MEVQFGPNPVDEPNLLYKLQRKIKVFNTDNGLPNRGYNLVTSSSKYGLVFVGIPDGTLSVYHLKDLVDKECEPKHFSLKLQEKPTHIEVSCDHELLAVTGGQLLCIYKVANFNNVNVSPALTIKLDANPATFVSALQWNPCIADNIAIAFFDGTLLVSSVASGQVKKVQSKARCICWSPKGKQLVTGNSDGSLCQYKPDLTLAKTVPAPNLFEGAPVEALAIYWISTFQFAVVFRNAADNSRPVVTVVNTPKAGQPSCFNYEDICYSMGSNRPWYYYLQSIAQWNVILASSSNSMEIATLGSTDGSNWTQWCQSDEARPELPLTDKKIENYPVGICIDTCGIHQLPWGENETLPHMPMLHVVSQSGLLTIFNIINLKFEGPNVCTPPQQLTLLSLPSNFLTSDIPGEAPAPVQVTLPPPPSALVKPQPIPAQPAQAAQPTQLVQPPSQPAQPPQQAVQPPQQAAQPLQSAFSSGGLSSMFGQAKPQFGTQSQFAQAFAAASQASEPPKPVEAQPKPQAQPPKPQPSQATEVNAALKAEQEKMTKLKADQELKSMLVKEVNDFQMELYKFVVRTKEVQNKLQQDLNAIEPNFIIQSLDTESLKKECDLEALRNAIVQLKLELVRACAVVAEARTHAEAKDMQWTQVDPLTSKRVASVKNLAYYVQSELEKAHKALDYKWNEMLARDPQYNKPGQRMIRPILDDVYQPLVKQQEILSRQQAVLRQLRNTLKEVDTGPMFKSTSLLRSTPFKNKDPLTKLTKNILNMSIEPQNNKSKDALFTPQKLDALRDMLSNHKPTKIKPVNVELRQHLAQMRINYENSVKKAQQEAKQAVKSEPAVPPQPVQMKQPQIAKPTAQPFTQSSLPAMSTIAKPDLISKPAPAINIPSFTPVNQSAKPGLNNVARTLFTDGNAVAASTPQQPQAVQPQMKLPTQAQPSSFAPPTSITASANTRSILKDMLQNKQVNNMPSGEAKNDGNLFMGQKICSPSAFAFSSVPSSNAQATQPFPSKPIADISNMFNKFTPQAFAPESKPQFAAPKAQNEEPIKPKIPDPKPIEIKKEEKPEGLFQIKIPAPVAASTPNVPDVLKTNTQATKVEKAVPKAEKVPEVSKENVPEKTAESVATQKKVEADKKDNAPKPFSFASGKAASAGSLFGSALSTPFGASANIAADLTKSTETKSDSKPETKTEEKPDEKVEEKTEAKPEAPKAEKSEAPVPSSNASSLFAAANAASPPASKPQSGFGTPTSTPQSPLFGSPAPPVSTTETKTDKESTPTTTSASSLFASAAASQPFAKTTQTGSLFSSSSTASSAFGSTQGSIFGTTPTTTQSSPSVFGTSTAQSVFSGAETKPTAFSVPTPASPAAVFASANATTPTTTPAQPAFGSPSGSIFGSSSPTSTPASVFGSAFGTAATTASVFATSTTTQSVFGTATTTTPSVFGATSTSSIFGSGSASPSAVFGAAATTAQSVFGSTATTQAASIFGGAATTQASIFGATTPSTQASVFGATTQSSVFGSATPSTQASVFGAPQTTQASVFGSQPATTASSLFGGGENLFAAASISTTSAGSSTSGGSIFGGGGGSSGSVFGSGGSSPNVFGSKTSFSQSNPQAAAIFGGGASFAQKPAAPATNFWSGGGATSTGSAFGSSGFGQQATTQASSIFGGGTGGSFSSPSTGTAFGSPTQQTSVFGSPQQQAAPAFGGSPVFGAKPAFGQPAAFGSPPSGGTGFGAFSGGFNKSPSSGFGAPAAFGGPPAFGAPAFGSTSPGKVFGGSSPPPSFASTQSNATFEQLATQNTLTFGNLAQQTPQPAAPAPSFNASPSFTGWRG
ncbi:hypothetical protein NE865_00245 [Phthorimaea operculella]|nr:hypothetical protein NE865_00245 [Phthorimaea operculella]